MARPDVTDVRNWVKALGGLCAGNLNVREAEARMTAFAPMLAREFRPDAFCLTSLVAVSRACSHHSPTFGEIANALSAWLADNGPTANVPLITGPQHDDWRARVEAEHAEAIADYARPEVIRQAVAALDGHPMRQVLGQMLAALVWRHAADNLTFLPPEFLANFDANGQPKEVR